MLITARFTPSQNKLQYECSGWRRHLHVLLPLGEPVQHVNPTICLCLSHTVIWFAFTLCACGCVCVFLCLSVVSLAFICFYHTISIGNFINNNYKAYVQCAVVFASVFSVLLIYADWRRKKIQMFILSSRAKQNKTKNMKHMHKRSYIHTHRQTNSE